MYWFYKDKYFYFFLSLCVFLLLPYVGVTMNQFLTLRMISGSKFDLVTYLHRGLNFKVIIYSTIL